MINMCSLSSDAFNNQITDKLNDELLNNLKPLKNEWPEDLYFETFSLLMCRGLVVMSCDSHSRGCGF